MSENRIKKLEKTVMAKEIRRLTGKEVFCIEEMLDYRPNLWQKARWGFKSDYLDKIRSVLPQSS